MSRAEAALLVTVSGLLLTGCVSMGDSDAQVSPNSATDERGLSTAKGEEVEVVAEESSLPPVGSFDPEAPDFDLFDPCTEISEESLRRAELGPPEEFLTPTAVHKACSFDDYKNSGEFISVVISAITVPLLELPTGFQDVEGGELPGSNWRIMRMAGESERVCQASVQTTKGTVNVELVEPRRTVEAHEICEHGIEILNNI